ncbi:hypothetical protein TSUD_246650 [Trifolium subterraneum]|uniref:Reverse transcriptase zinc-binding domain-containing protein n=1 Tax=Trifolium subterraneum TaxID=3900 RepID=A0A2Z6PK64_TRISU|nr:hypothetical protein TSUD_246650 [Trifolium subterraneum]
MASDFLNCRIGKTPFKYLGLPVGANSRKMSTWEPMLDTIRGRLSSWSCKYIETTIHLFLHCDWVAKVWYEITRWLGFTLIIPPNLAISFAMWATCVSNKKEKKGICLIWNAFMWVVWKTRNRCIFNNMAAICEEVVEQIKVMSWQWFIGRMAKAPCLLYEWKWSPIDCMRR